MQYAYMHKQHLLAFGALGFRDFGQAPPRYTRLTGALSFLAVRLSICASELLE